MIALCREAAAREGLEPSLYVQPKHELDLSRRYRTVFMCGALGVGSTRAEDQEALRRVYDHLEPGGIFVLDNEVPYADGNGWQYWQSEGRATLPRPRRPARESAASARTERSTSCARGCSTSTRSNSG